MNILGLPKIEDRKMSTNPMVRFFLPPLFTHKSDDTFILYQCARVSFYITSFFIVISWLSLLFENNFKLIFLDINLSREDFIKDYAKNLKSYGVCIIMFLLVPFYTIKYLYNIKIKNVDIMWWYKRIKPETKLKRFKVLICSVLLLLTISLTYFYSHYFTYNILNRVDYYGKNNLENSYYFLIFLSIFYLIFYSSVASITVYLIIVINKFMFFFTENLSSNYIHNGEQK